MENGVTWMKSKQERNAASRTIILRGRAWKAGRNGAATCSGKPCLREVGRSTPRIDKLCAAIEERISDRHRDLPGLHRRLGGDRKDPHSPRRATPRRIFPTAGLTIGVGWIEVPPRVRRWDWEAGMQINITAMGPPDSSPAKGMGDVCLLETKRRAFIDPPSREDW